MTTGNLPPEILDLPARHPERMRASARQWFHDNRDERLADRKRDYDRRRAAGLCARYGCPAQAAPGRTLCEPHAQDRRARYAARYSPRAGDRCCTCGGDLLIDGTCPKCAPEPVTAAGPRASRAPAPELRSVRAPERGPDGWGLVIEYADGTTRSESFDTFLRARERADRLLALVVVKDDPPPQLPRLKPARRRA